MALGVRLGGQDLMGKAEHPLTAEQIGVQRYGAPSPFNCKHLNGCRLHPYPTVYLHPTKRGEPQPAPCVLVREKSRRTFWVREHPSQRA